MNINPSKVCTLTYDPTKGRNWSNGHLIHRPTTEPYDICTLHDTLVTGQELIMEYHLNHLNYPTREDGYYPYQHVQDMGYHVIAFNTPFGKNGRIVTRYRLYLVYSDETGDLRYHVCTDKFPTAAAMLKYLDELRFIKELS